MTIGNYVYIIPGIIDNNNNNYTDNVSIIGQGKYILDQIYIYQNELISLFSFIKFKISRDELNLILNGIDYLKYLKHIKIICKIDDYDLYLLYVLVNVCINKFDNNIKLIYDELNIICNDYYDLVNCIYGRIFYYTLYSIIYIYDKVKYIKDNKLTKVINYINILYTNEKGTYYNITFDEAKDYFIEELFIFIDDILEDIRIKNPTNDKIIKLIEENNINSEISKELVYRYNYYNNDYEFVELDHDMNISEPMNFIDIINKYFKNNYCLLFGKSYKDNIIDKCDNIVYKCIGKDGDKRMCKKKFLSLELDILFKYWDMIDSNIQRYLAYKILTGLGFDINNDKLWNIYFYNSKEYISEVLDITDNDKNKKHIEYIENLITKINHIPFHPSYIKRAKDIFNIEYIKNNKPPLKIDKNLLNKYFRLDNISILEIKKNLDKYYFILKNDKAISIKDINSIDNILLEYLMSEKKLKEHRTLENLQEYEYICKSLKELYYKVIAKFLCWDSFNENIPLEQSLLKYIILMEK